MMLITIGAHKPARAARDILWRGLLLLCMVLTWPVCGNTADTRMQAPRLLDIEHPLVDRIWDVQAGEFISREKFTLRVLDSEYLLLGETHDNRRHHEIQAQIIDALHRAQRTASVAFEMINDAQGRALSSRQFASADALIEVLRSIEDKWPYARDYRIVFDSVLGAGFALRAANLQQDTIRRILRDGESILPRDLREHLQAVSFSSQQHSALIDDIVSAHCDLIPAEAAQPMVTVQRVRDAVMSQSLLQSQTPVKVLIAGAGHVRKDFGVPYYLKAHHNNVHSLALGLIEVKPGLDKPTAYIERWNTPQLPFDYVWFTPRATREDPCAGLREKMQMQR